MDGQADLGVEGLHHALGAVRGEHACHVLDGDGIGTQVLQLLAILEEAIERMHRGHSVRDRTLEMPTAFLDSLSAIHDVADVVERIEYAEHIDAVAMRCGYESRNNFFGIMLVTDQVLATGEHGKTRVGRFRLDGTKAIPRILVQETKAGVERRTAPSLDSPITYAIHLRQDREHITDWHTRCPKALLAITNGGIHDL